MRDHAIHNRWKRKLATAIVTTRSGGQSKITAERGGESIAADKAEVRLIRCGDRTKSHSATVRTRTMSSGAFLTEKPQEDRMPRTA